ncbi:MAG TPA: FMN-binding protein, partial [Spirochaetales bacterium]|nr:FMN-binding protein [Spirochaetales bacterium]
MKKDILRLGIALALFAAGACAALAVVYTVTGPTIAGHEREQLQASLKDLFPDADGFVEIDGSIRSSVPDVTVLGSWKAARGDATLGVAIRASASSYGGDAVMLVGVATDRRIAGARVMTLSDTPGLGANATNPSYFVDKAAKTTFPGQFSGKSVLDEFEVK